MRKTVIALAAVVAVAAGALVGALAASGGSGTSSASEQQLQRRGADLWEIDLLEKNFHKATSRKDIGADDEPVGSERDLDRWGDQSAVGREQIRKFWLTKSENFQARQHLDLRNHPLQGPHHGSTETGAPCTSSAITSSAKTGKLEKITAAWDGDVARINGRWLFTNVGWSVCDAVALRP